jgi:hypothetical protein
VKSYARGCGGRGATSNTDPSTRNERSGSCAIAALRMTWRGDPFGKRDVSGEVHNTDSSTRNEARDPLRFFFTSFEVLRDAPGHVLRDGQSVRGASSPEDQHRRFTIGRSCGRCGRWRLDAASPNQRDTRRRLLVFTSFEVHGVRFATHGVRFAMLRDAPGCYATLRDATRCSAIVVLQPSSSDPFMYAMVRPCA